MLNLPTDHPLAGMVRQFQRADSELKTLDDRISEFRQTHLGRLHMEKYPGGHFSIYAVAGQPDPNWGIDAGDILLHLRTCLDYLVYQIAVDHHGQDPPPGERQIQFPIYSPDKILPEAAITKWAGPSVYAWLQSIQPQPGTEYMELERLAILTNRYKHRRLAVVAVGIISSDIRVVPTRDLLVLEQPSQFRGMVKHGQEIGRGRVAITGPDPQEEVDAHVTEDVVFGESGPFAGEPVSRVLHIIRDVVERVIREGWLNFFRVYRKPWRFAVRKAVVPTISISGGCGHWTSENATQDGCDLVHTGYPDHEGYEFPEVEATANP